MRFVLPLSSALFGLLLLTVSTPVNAASASATVTTTRSAANRSYVPMSQYLSQDIPERFRPVQYNMIRAERADYYFFPETLPNRIVETGRKTTINRDEWPSWIGLPGWWN